MNNVFAPVTDPIEELVQTKTKKRPKRDKEKINRNNLNDQSVEIKQRAKPRKPHRRLLRVWTTRSGF